MPREMFVDIVDPTVKVGNRSWYTVPVSIAAHTGLLLAMIIIPLMAAPLLPGVPDAMSAFVAKPIGMADAAPAESAAPPSAANPTSACLSFTLLSVVLSPLGK